MNAITVREARRTDVPAIRAINAAGMPGVSPLTQRELDAIAEGGIRCWIAEATDGIVGYMIVYRSSDTYDGEEFAWFRYQYGTFLYIDEVAVALNSRHGGVGSALYRTARAYALAQGCAALACEVNLDPPNPISLSFHRSIGFQHVGVLHTEDGRTVALLYLPLYLPLSPDSDASSSR